MTPLDFGDNHLGLTFVFVAVFVLLIYDAIANAVVNLAKYKHSADSGGAKREGE